MPRPHHIPVFYSTLLNWQLIGIWVVVSLVQIPKPANSLYQNIDHPLYNEVITVEYKVHVDAGKKDCYYQFVKPAALFYVDFNVISGGDGKCGFSVVDPNGQNVFESEWKEGGSFESEAAVEGYYEICINNELSIFSSRVVNFYVHTYMNIFTDIVNPGYNEEAELEDGLHNLTMLLWGIDNRLNKMLTQLHQSRAEESRDFALLQQNNFYVLFWSVLQCFVIIITSKLHIFFVRKLFEVPEAQTTNPNLKYRRK